MAAGAPAVANKTARKTSTTASKKTKTPAKTNPAPARSTKAVNNDRRQTQKDINETRRKIEDNSVRTRQNLDRLNNLNAQIDRQQSSIADLNAMVSNLDSTITVVTDSISMLGEQLDTLKTSLRLTMRQARIRSQRLNPFSLLFSAADFNDAVARIGHLSRLRARQARRINELRTLSDELDRRRARLDTLHQQQNVALSKLSIAHDVLVGQQNESQRVANTLKREGADLRRLLNEKQQRLRQLDDELNRYTTPAKPQKPAAKPQKPASKPQSAAQAQKPARTQTPKPNTPSNTATAHTSISEDVSRASRAALPGSFADAKGRLMFPVAGRYTITGTFGRGTHAGLAVDNSGIDIAVAPGSQARAVYDGTVATIFEAKSYHNVIIVRHGDYLTVYAGLGPVNVTRGSKVSAGQSLGTIYTDDVVGRTELHFEVRHERDKLNPLAWVKQ